MKKNIIKNCCYLFLKKKSLTKEREKKMEKYHDDKNKMVE